MGAEDLGGVPGRVGCAGAGLAVEELHLPRGEDRYYVEVAAGGGVVDVEVDVGGDERGAGGEDQAGGGDGVADYPAAGFGVADVLMGGWVSNWVIMRKGKRKEKEKKKPTSCKPPKSVLTTNENDESSSCVNPGYPFSPPKGLLPR